MTWEITWHPLALKFLEKLPIIISERILKKLDIVAEDPFRYLEHFEGQPYKLRIGDYRALIDVDFSENSLLILVLDKRGRIYKR